MGNRGPVQVKVERGSPEVHTLLNGFGCTERSLTELGSLCAGINEKYVDPHIRWRGKGYKGDRKGFQEEKCLKHNMLF